MWVNDVCVIHMHWPTHIRIAHIANAMTITVTIVLTATMR